MLKLILKIYIVAFTLISCFNLDNSNPILLYEIGNSNRTKKAVLAGNEGNATVDLSLHVSILEYTDRISVKEVGNTFTVDDNHGSTRLDSTSIKLNWIGNDTLQIEYDKKLRTFTQKEKVNGVTVVYVEK